MGPRGELHNDSHFTKGETEALRAPGSCLQSSTWCMREPELKPRAAWLQSSFLNTMSHAFETIKFVPCHGFARNELWVYIFKNGEGVGLDLGDTWSHSLERKRDLPTQITPRA